MNIWERKVDVDIYIIYTPNLGSEIIVSVREREAGSLWREHRESIEKTQ